MNKAVTEVWIWITLTMALGTSLSIGSVVHEAGASPSLSWGIGILALAIVTLLSGLKYFAYNRSRE